MLNRPSRSVMSVIFGLVLWLSLSEPGLKCARSAIDQVTSLGVSWGILEFTQPGGSSEEGFEEPLGPVAVSDDVSEAMDDDQRQILRTITEHCLPKLVCELYSKEFGSSLTDGEVTLMSLIGVTNLSPAGPSKYHYAAHMGQLIRGVEGNGCHEFFPRCPFSGEDVRQIARKINLK